MKAKLSNEYRKRLTTLQQEYARSVIRYLEPTCEDGCCAANNAVGIAVARGRIVAGDRSHSLSTSRAPVGKVVCMAVEAGLLPAKGAADTSPSDDGDGTGDPGSPGLGSGSGDRDAFDGAPDSDAEPSGGGGNASDGDGDEPTDASSDSNATDGGADSDGEEEDATSDDASDSGAADSSAPSNGTDPESKAAESLLERLWELRTICERGEGVSDILSTRTIANSARMHYLGGFPDEAIIHAVALNWSPNVRESLGILPVEASGVARREARELPDPGEHTRHEIFDYVLGIARSGIGALLVGDAGSGKSYLGRQLAAALGGANTGALDFGAIPLSEDASVAWLLGRHTPQGYIEAPLVRCYRDGGVFLFDELDAADSNALLVVNDALANGALENPLTGERIKRHPEFIPIAAANTYGRGADGQYVGRKALDLSTLDRWRCGRVKVEYDRKLERRIFLGADA